MGCGISIDDGLKQLKSSLTQKGDTVNWYTFFGGEELFLK